MDARRMLLFAVGEQRWAIEMAHLREVAQGSRLYGVPLARDSVAGLINLRGQIVTMVDVAACLTESRETTCESWTCLVLKTQDERTARGLDALSSFFAGSDLVGLLVQEELGMIDVSSDDIRSVPGHVEKSLAGFVSGIVHQAEQLVLVLNLRALIESACSFARGNR